MKKLTSAVVASSLVLGLVSSAFAAPSTEQINDAFARLSAYNVVQGKAMADGTVSPALGDTLTRAELVTILARAFGQEETAKLLKGATSFSDVAANEWYSGYVALIKNIAESKKTAVGYEDGTFRPNQNVKAIEALAFIMKLLGVQPGTGANWVADTIAAAKDAGIITAADAEAYLAAPTADATRGLAFGLADAIFRTYQVSAGKTVYTTYVDNVKPVLTINKPAEPTTTKTAYTVTGKAEGATAVYFGSEKITANADGSFTVDVSLAMGANTITFSAVDMAGNITEESFSLTRNAGAAEKVAASLSATSVMAGATADLTYTITDANGTVLTVNADDVTVVVAGDIGSFDKAAGKLTAATKVATGTITVSYGTLTPATINVEVVAGALTTVVADSGSAAPGAAVKLVAKDAYDNVISGATFSETSADAFIEGGNFVATKAGQYTVTATKDGATASGVVGVFGGVAKTVIEAPAVMVANDATEYEVSVKVVDAEGNLITSAGNKVELTVPTGFTEVDGLTAKEAKNGVATFTYTIDSDLADADLTLTARYDVDDDDIFDGTKDKKGTLVVTPAAQVATKITLDAGDDYLASDDVTNTDVITVNVLDQAGVEMIAGTWEMDITVTGPAVLENDKKTDSISVGSGSTFAILPEDAGASGNISISAAFAGLATGTASVKAAMPGVATALKLTENKDSFKADSEADAETTKNVVTYTIVSVDRNGVPTTNGAPTAASLTLDSDLKNAYSFYGTAALDPIGVGGVSPTFDLTSGAQTFMVASSKVGTYDVSVSATDFTKVSDSFTVNANKPGVAALTKAEIDVLRGSESTAVATAQLYDKFGNKSAVSGVSVTFKSGSYDGIKLNTKGEDVTVTTDETGKASVTVTMASYVASASITVVDGDADDVYTLTTYAGALSWITSTVPSDTLAVTVVNAIADSITGSITAEDDTTKILRSISADGVGGKYVQLHFTVKDNFGRVVTGLAADAARNFKLSTTVSDLDLSGIAITEILDGESNPTGSYVTDGIEWTTVGSVDITVEVASVAKELKLTRTYTVTPGVATNVALAEGKEGSFGAAASTQELTVEANKVTKVTVQITDAYGNVVSATSNTATVRAYFAVTPAAGNYVSFRNADGAQITYVEIKAGRNTATFYVVTDAVEIDQEFDLAAYTKAGTEWDGPAAAAVGDTEDGLFGTLTITIQ